MLQADIWERYHLCVGNWLVNKLKGRVRVADTVMIYNSILNFESYLVHNIKRSSLTCFILPSKTQSNWIFFVQFNTSSEMHLKPPIKVSRGSHAAAVAPALEGKVFISLSQNGMAHWYCWINVLRRCWIQLEFALHLQCGCLKIPEGGPKNPDMAF